MKKRIFTILVIFIIFINSGFSQNTEKKEDQTQQISNVFLYTPSKLLKKGQVESQLFNNVYTQTSYRDEHRNKIDLERRETYYTGLFYFLYGISSNSRINIGFDLIFKSVRWDSPESSFFKVFKFQNNDSARVALSHIGPKIKFTPVKNMNNLSVQSAFWIPLTSDLEGNDDPGIVKPFLDWDAYVWWSQVFYDMTFGSRYQLFTEADLRFRFRNEKDSWADPVELDIPLSVFFSYFPTMKATLYVQYQYSPTVTQSATWFMQAGIGAKYQVARSLGLEISYTNFFASASNGAGETFNLGIRFIR